MMIIGCDFHPGFQQIAYVELETGEYGERRLNHRTEAEQFYRSLAGKQVRIGVEATGGLRWFRKLMHELGHELLLGRCQCDPGQQSTEAEDGYARCQAYIESCGGEPVSSHLAAADGERGSSPVASSSLPDGSDADGDQKPVGHDGQERRLSQLAELVEEAPAADRGLTVVGLACAATQGSFRADGGVGQADRASGQGGAGSLQAKPRSGPVDDPSGRRAGCVLGLCAHPGRLETIPQGQAGGELSWFNPGRSVQRQEAAAAGTHQ